MPGPLASCWEGGNPGQTGTKRASSKDATLFSRHRCSVSQIDKPDTVAYVRCIGARHKLAAAPAEHQRSLQDSPGDSERAEARSIPSFVGHGMMRVCCFNRIPNCQSHHSSHQTRRRFPYSVPASTLSRRSRSSDHRHDASPDHLGQTGPCGDQASKLGVDGLGFTTRCGGYCGCRLRRFYKRLWNQVLRDCMSGF